MFLRFNFCAINALKRIISKCHQKSEMEERERERNKERERENVGEIDGRHCQDIEMALSVAVDRHRTL